MGLLSYKFISINSSLDLSIYWNFSLKTNIIFATNLTFDFKCINFLFVQMILLNGIIIIEDSSPISPLKFMILPYLLWKYNSLLSPCCHLMCQGGQHTMIYYDLKILSSNSPYFVQLSLFYKLIDVFSIDPP